MRMPLTVRRHLAALRALLVLSVITGVLYPLAMLAIARLPGLSAKADGSLVIGPGAAVVGSSLIGQPFVDGSGRPLRQYFQSRPSNAADPDNPADPGDNPLFSGASNLGPESVQDVLPDPRLTAAGKADPNAKTSLLSTVCKRSAAVGRMEGVDGSRPFCTPGGVGAVLSVIGPRDASGKVAHPTRVVSVNEECSADPAKPVVPFLAGYEGVKVECAQYGQDYSIGLITPIRGSAPAHPKVPADAVTGSGSGLDPQISVDYARLQVNRVAAARHLPAETVRRLLDAGTQGRTLGFIGEPVVNVLRLNLALDRAYPYRG